jgi:hypothetical protein
MSQPSNKRRDTRRSGERNVPSDAMLEARREHEADALAAAAAAAAATATAQGSDDSAAAAASSSSAGAGPPPPGGDSGTGGAQVGSSVGSPLEKPSAGTDSVFAGFQVFDSTSVHQRHFNMATHMVRRWVLITDLLWKVSGAHEANNIYMWVNRDTVQVSKQDDREVIILGGADLRSDDETVRSCFASDDEAEKTGLFQHQYNDEAMNETRLECLSASQAEIVFRAPDDTTDRFLKPKHNIWSVGVLWGQFVTGQDFPARSMLRSSFYETLQNQTLKHTAFQVACEQRLMLVDQTFIRKFDQMPHLYKSLKYLMLSDGTELLPPAAAAACGPTTTFDKAQWMKLALQGLWEDLRGIHSDIHESATTKKKKKKARKKVLAIKIAALDFLVTSLQDSADRAASAAATAASAAASAAHQMRSVFETLPESFIHDKKAHTFILEAACEALRSGTRGTATQMASKMQQMDVRDARARDPWCKAIDKMAEEVDRQLSSPALGSPFLWGSYTANEVLDGAILLAFKKHFQS